VRAGGARRGRDGEQGDGHGAGEVGASAHIATLLADPRAAGLALHGP